eukprot:9649900-Karenia_brevis.AAC.1
MRSRAATSVWIAASLVRISCNIASSVGGDGPVEGAAPVEEAAPAVGDHGPVEEAAPVDDGCEGAAAAAVLSL